MAIYIKIDPIKGDVTAKKYEQWIELESFQFGTKRTLHTTPGKIFDRESTRPNISEIIIHKRLDKASPILFTESCVGKAKQNVLIHFVQTGDGIMPYMEYTLNNVIISGYNISFSPNHVAQDFSQSSLTAMEMLSLNFDKIEMRYTPYDEKHNPLSPIPSGYDLSTAQKI